MNSKLFKHTSLIIYLSILLTSCSEIKTDNAFETYRHWAGTDPTEDIELINGQYWQSSHWTKEYIMYLKLKPTKKWLDLFLQQNQLVIDNRKWTRPYDAPIWFEPSDNSIRYSDGKEFDQGTRFIYDSISGFCFFYEIQL